ncbi:MAG TPA: NAD(P)/FAD-dependent oxidoreductase [Candidatus Limnocylindrales bacterium]|nr:NAD(P)/FAD-dependent oxidoreductase [Candidatus Limnocylindrales bacterium]
MRIAVVGGGTGGAASALLLARDGHDVEIFERVPDPRPVGAGILLQPLGQRILATLGLADELEQASTPVRRIEGRIGGPNGRFLLRFGYEDARSPHVGLGVNRGALFGVLWKALEAAGVPAHVGWEVDRVHLEPDGAQLVRTDGETAGPFDLVVAADGARSRIRRQLGLATKDIRYPFGALWTVVPDPDGLVPDALVQRYRDTRTMLGFLPTGIGETSIFWSIRNRDAEAAIAAGPGWFVDRALPYAPDFAPLLERVREARILNAAYRDVVVPHPSTVVGRAGVALVGDAAHAMSPQLGMGASLALADAWSLAAALRDTTSLAEALDAYGRDRRAHVRWYTWLSRLMTPAFQSNLVPLAWGRDPMFSLAAEIGLARAQFAKILLGEQTSPFTLWAPAKRGGPLAPAPNLERDSVRYRSAT